MINKIDINLRTINWKDKLEEIKKKMNYQWNNEFYLFQTF